MNAIQTYKPTTMKRWYMINTGKALYLLLWLLLITLLLPVVAQASVNAQLDRSTINEGETFTLNLAVSGSNSSQPDLSGLHKDFDVIGTGQKSMIQIINGSVQSQHSWTITLSPRHTGTLQIPSIPIGNDSSNALTVTVLPASASMNSGAAPAHVFIEVSAKPDKVYVQSQLLYTVRLYYDTPLQQGTLSKPSLDNAIVQKLGKDSNFETQRGGRRYQVIERRYAIFPQHSGKLEIPSLVFDGDINDPSAQTGDPFFDNFNPATRHVHLRSHKLDIQVAGQPVAYQGANWLPAQDIRLEEKWSPHQPQFRVGEPVTRTLIIHAKGLSASQLPDLPLPTLQNVKLYPDQAQTKDHPEGDTLKSQREQKIAMIPTQAGDLVLPSIHLNWWDTAAQHERTATLPAETIHVLPAAGTATTTANTTPAPHAAPSAQMTPSQTPAPSPAKEATKVETTSSPTLSRQGIWMTLTIVFGLAWLITLLLWWRHKQPRPAAPNQQVMEAPGQILAKQVRLACQQQDPQAVKRALLNWARKLWPHTPPLSLGALVTQIQPDPLAMTIATLDKMLYAVNAENWQADALLQTFNAYCKQSRNRVQQTPASALAPLHLHKSRVNAK